MQSRQKIILCLLFLSLFSFGSHADEVYLKSGQAIKGDILEETGESTTLRLEGSNIVVKYYVDEIDHVQKKTDAGVPQSSERINSDTIPDKEDWWQYVMDDGGKSKITRTFYRGVEDVKVRGAIFKGCSKEIVKTAEIYQDVTREVEECTLWSAADIGIIKKDCVKREYDANQQVRETETEEMLLQSAQVNGKLINIGH